jgi:hypothetical protein
MCGFFLFIDIHNSQDMILNIEDRGERFHESPIHRLIMYGRSADVFDYNYSDEEIDRIIKSRFWNPRFIKSLHPWNADHPPS